MSAEAQITTGLGIILLIYGIMTFPIKYFDVPADFFDLLPILAGISLILWGAKKRRLTRL
jgi:hypothetical protein